MAGEATATVTFSTRSVHEELRGPTGARLWRPGYLACLVEKHLPTWVVTPIGFAAAEEPGRLVVVSRGATDRPAVSDLVVLMAGLFGGSDRLRDLAMREGLFYQAGQAWWAAPSIKLPTWSDNEDDEELDVGPVLASDELFREAATIVAERCRVTVMAYPRSLIAAEDSVTWLRGIGVDVDEFGLVTLGSEEQRRSER